MAKVNNIEFVSNTKIIKNKMDSQILKWLEEASGTIEAEAKRTSRVDQGNLKQSWRHKVDKTKLEAQIGSPLENAIWEEFGTGEWAVDNKGRKGYWVFVVGEGGVQSKSPKSYTLAEAKKIMAIMRKKGLNAFYTNGKKPQHTLENAMKKKKNNIQKRLNQLLSEVGK